MSDIFAKLAEPFPPEAVSWRPGSMTKDKARAQALAYLDARDVMQRLDDVLGPAGWQNTHPAMHNGTNCCEISVLIDGVWIAKSNGAGASDIEGEKGAYSDAFKRAAVMWGVGRYLYDIKAPWVELDEYKRIKATELPKLHALLARGGAKPISSYAAKKDEGSWKKHVSELQRAGYDGRVNDYLKSVQSETSLWPDKWQERWAELIEQARNHEPQR